MKQSGPPVGPALRPQRRAAFVNQRSISDKRSAGLGKQSAFAYPAPVTFPHASSIETRLRVSGAGFAVRTEVLIIP